MLRKLFSAAFLLLVLGLVGVGFQSARFRPTQADVANAEVEEQRKVIESQLGSLFKNNEFVSETKLDWQGDETQVRVHYSFDESLQKEADMLLRQYRPDYGTVVAVDATTGKVLALASYEGSKPSQTNWALKATFPAASIFKVVTAAVALDKYRISPDLELAYNGSNYTMYKRNLFSEQTNRWSRSISLRDAFAKSINIFFGKMSLKFLQPSDLMEYANRFKFNEEVPSDLPLEMSEASVVTDDPYNVAEVASGFNDVNTLSPLHGAMMAASIAYDGVMKAPYVVEKIENLDGQTLYESKPLILGQTVNTETARKLRLLMNETIESGTSRKSFREMSRSPKFAEIEVGGKTGSLQGQNPKGKTDWFVGYGKHGPHIIAVAAVTVNKEYWRVKSAYLAQRMIRKFFTEEINSSKRELATEKK